MGKLRQLNPELWPLIYLILFSYIELIFRGGVSCLPAALLFSVVLNGILFILTGNDDIHKSLEIQPDPITDHRVSCPLASEKLMFPFFLALYDGSQVSIVALWATCFTK